MKTSLLCPCKVSCIILNYTDNIKDAVIISNNGSRCVFFSASVFLGSQQNLPLSAVNIKQVTSQSAESKHDAQ